MKISNKKKKSRTEFFLDPAIVIAAKKLSKTCSIVNKDLLGLCKTMSKLDKVNDRKKVTISQGETHIQANILNNKELLKELEKIENLEF